MAYTYLNEQPLKPLDLLSVKPLREVPGGGTMLVAHTHTATHPRDRRPPQKPRWLVADFLKPLERAVVEANRILQESSSNTRFALQREGERVLFELLRLSGDGQGVVVKREDITEDDFRRWIHNIAALSGVVVDCAG
jgi:hypothetical protein